MFNWLFKYMLECRLRTREGRRDILIQTYEALEKDFSENNDPTNVYEWFTSMLSAVPKTTLLNTKIYSLCKEAIQERLK